MGLMTDFNSPDNLSGGALGAVATLTLFGADVAISQTNLVTAAVKAPFDLIPLSVELCSRSTTGAAQTVGLRNSTDANDIFANLQLGASGVPIQNSTVVAANNVVQKGDIMHLRATTDGSSTIVGLQAVLTYLATGVPTNRTD